MSLVLLYVGIGVVVGGIAAIILYANLPTKWTIGHIVPTAVYLSMAKLIKMTDEMIEHMNYDNYITADSLFKEGACLVMAVRRPGCLLCRREAAALSTLKEVCDEKNVRMWSVVHETTGVKEFKPFFSGDVYFDQEKRFYGPNQRWLPLWMGFLRVGTYINGYKTRKAGFSGNLVGEGRLLGGVYLINENEVVWSHLEKEWGDAADLNEVKTALLRF